MLCAKKGDLALNLNLVGVQEEMQPWFRDFTGDMEVKNATSYITRGRFELTEKGELIVTELPIRRWTQVTSVLRPHPPSSAHDY